MTNPKVLSPSQRKQARLKRLPALARKLVTNPAAARNFIAAAPFARMAISAGISPTPGMGIREFDAMLAIVKDAVGVASLTDEEFEHALRLSTPPECREKAQ